MKADFSQEPLPPHDELAERGVLGSILIDPGALALLDLDPDDFHDEGNARFYAAMLALQEKHVAVDATTLHSELGGGTDDMMYIMELITDTPTSAHVQHYARIVAERADKRRLGDAAAEIARMAYDDAVAPTEAESEAMDLITKARRRAARRTEPLSDLVRAYYDKVELRAREGGTLGLPTGFRDVDTILGGLQASDMIILAARPSMGKTSLALNIAANVARMEHTVAFFSLEMSNDQVVQRLFTADSAIPGQSLKTGKLMDSEWQAFTDTTGRMETLPLWIDDTPGITPGGLRARCLRVRAMAKGLSLVVVDYLQLMRDKGRGRFEIVTEISQSIKALARDLGVPVLALSQLSRGVESRLDKRPRLSDLRESGALEQDADIVMFIYRDEMYNEDTERKGLADVIVAKHRNGPTGTAVLRFESNLVRFSNADVRHIDDDSYDVL